METINLKVPFMPLSTTVNRTGEIEKRFFTPFGTVDVVFRNVLDMKNENHHMVIEVGGDAEYWASCDSPVTEFKAALLQFIRGMIAEDHFDGKTRMDSSKVSLRIKGSGSNPAGPRENIVLGKWGF